MIVQSHDQQNYQFLLVIWVILYSATSATKSVTYRMHKSILAKKHKL